MLLLFPRRVRYDLPCTGGEFFFNFPALAVTSDPRRGRMKSSIVLPFQVIYVNRNREKEVVRIVWVRNNPLEFGRAPDFRGRYLGHCGLERLGY